MKRASLSLTIFTAICLVASLLSFGRPADAQDGAEATIAALQTRVAELEGTVEARGQKINAQRTQIAELKSSESGSAASTGPAPTPRPTVDPNAPKGTRANPVPLGTPIQIGNWVITVLSAIPDATDLVMAENRFNDPPASGHQFFIVRLRAEYVGNESDTITYSVWFSAVGASNVAYEPGLKDSCGVIPDELPSSEVFPGGSIEGNVCWSVKTEDADSLVMFGEELFSRDSRVYFALR